MRHTMFTIATRPTSHQSSKRTKSPITFFRALSFTQVKQINAYKRTTPKSRNIFQNFGKSLENMPTYAAKRIPNDTRKLGIT